MDEDIPEGYTMQIGRPEFDFGIVTRAPWFRMYSEFAERADLVSDISIYDDAETPVTEQQYINVKQKSALWFKLRALANNTASSLGKYIKSPTTYPTMEDVSSHWADKLNKVPLDITHTMRGHMRWGVGYEDPALVHFAVENMLHVQQVGTIRVPYSFLMSYCEYSNGLEGHLLVSPDGVVYDNDRIKPVGMLEIKCISPFHHVEEQGKLSWVDNMETRQWTHPQEIPFAYVVQICLQALAGIYRLEMTLDDTMWFIRWSPRGFSEFRVQFRDLVRLGALCTVLYSSLEHRISTILPIVYTKAEQELHNEMCREYHKLMAAMTHRYIRLEQLYPEFFVYMDCTRMFKFVVAP